MARPVSQMTAAMRALAEGDLQVTIPARGRRDKIGQMAEAVQVFKNNLVETERLRKATAMSLTGTQIEATIRLPVLLRQRKRRGPVYRPWPRPPRN